MILLICILAVAVGLAALNNFFGLKGKKFDIYFGVPGSGKTTVAAWITKGDLKQKIPVYSNVPIKGAYAVEKDDIGVYNIHDGRLIIDEAGAEFNNRKWKSLTEEQIKWFKKHRHFGVDIAVFSQSYDDCDITLRRLATRLFLMKKSIIPYFVKKKRILKKIGINKDTKQIEDQYYFQFFLFGTKYIFCPPLWKLFKKEERYDLPEKEFEVYQ